MAASRTLVLAFFFASGLCGLLYEVVWVRAAATVIGSTTYAVGTVVAVYMAGLALGAWRGGRAADRRSGASLLRLYGLLEAGVAVSALAVPPLLDLSTPLFRLLWNFAGEVAPLYATLRLLLVALLLIVPTTLMGATLPVLSRFLASSIAAAPREAGRAYAVNTLGGVAGTLAAGFILVPGLGLRATTLGAALLNLAIAGAALLLARSASAELLPETREDAPPRRPALAVAALSGFAALVYEVAWTRSLVLSFGSTVYAFTLILAAFILGLALGSGAMALLEARFRRAETALGGVQVAIGVLALGLLPFLGDLPLRVAATLERLRERPGDLLWAEAGILGLLVLVPSLFMGAVFPLACRMAGGSDRAVGRSVGAVYTWNTIGAIAGSLAASFLFVPWIGLDASIRAAATLNLVLAGLLLLSGPARLRPAVLLPAAAAAAAWLLPAWNPKILSSGLYLYGSMEGRGAREKGVDLRSHLERDTDLLGQYWDAYGLVTVHRRHDGVISMRVNGKADASTGPIDTANMLYVAHLPLLHHPAPRRALLIGLGGGLTLGAMERHPLERIDCVEISRAVVRGQAHFREAVGDVLGDPRARLILGDGRNVLLFGREPYDVIISQPSNLWVSGMANLFTRDFFEEASRRLSPGGLFGQWIHAYRLSVHDFRDVVRTFAAVFPQGGLWEVFPGSDYVLIGSRDALPLEAGALAERIAKTKALEEYLGPDPVVGLLGHLVADASRVRSSAGPGRIITDDRCSIEYTAPRALSRDTSREVLDWLSLLRRETPALPAGMDGARAAAAARRRQARAALAEAVALRSEGHQPRALALFARERAELHVDPRTRAFLDRASAEIVESAQKWRDEGRAKGAIVALRQVPRESSHYAAAQAELGDLHHEAGAIAEARAAFEEASRADPRSFPAAVGLAQILEVEGRFAAAAERYRDALAIRGDSAPAHAALASCLSRAGRAEEALQAARRALEIDPGNERARGILDPPRRP
jgi:spermidine synthase